MVYEEKQHYSQYLATVWTALMNETTPPPPERQFLLWLTHFTPEMVEEGISVAANKAFTAERNGRVMPVNEVLRYASGVMRNVYLKREGQEGGTYGAGQR